MDKLLRSLSGGIGKKPSDADAERDIPTPPAVDVLCLLDSYVSAHNSARDDLKASIWKIGKARRGKGGFHMGSSSTSFTALNVREELRARAVLLCAEPDLVDEDNGGDSAVKAGGEEDLFTLYPDGIPKEKEAEVTIETDGDTSTSGSGLRQRKNAPKKASTTENEEKSAWTEETLLADEEEEKLRKANPIDLFGGLPPPTLRAAQAKAKASLEHYVMAANLAAEIIRITNEGSKETKRNSKEKR